jgi:hypothetical protein
MATFVLIPGAGTDPRVYGATIDALRGLGHEGLAPPLPLDDPEAGPSDHAAAVARATPDDPCRTKPPSSAIAAMDGVVRSVATIYHRV